MQTNVSPRPVRRYTVQYRGHTGPRREDVTAADQAEALRIARRRWPGSEHRVIGRGQ